MALITGKAASLSVMSQEEARAMVIITGVNDGHGPAFLAVRQNFFQVCLIGHSSTTAPTCSSQVSCLEMPFSVVMETGTTMLCSQLAK